MTEDQERCFVKEPRCQGINRLPEGSRCDAVVLLHSRPYGRGLAALINGGRDHEAIWAQLNVRLRALGFRAGYDFHMQAEHEVGGLK